MQVIILAAGDQTRMCGLSMPKVLLPYQGKAVLSHIIESWQTAYAPKTVEFVVAIREQDSLIKDYLNVALPRDTKLTVVVVPESYRSKGPVGTLSCVFSELPYSGPIAVSVGDGVYQLPERFIDRDATACLFVDNKGGSPDYLNIGPYVDGRFQFYDKEDTSKDTATIFSWSGVAFFKRAYDLATAVESAMASVEPCKEVSFADVFSLLQPQYVKLISMPFVDLGTREKYEKYVPESSIYDKLHQVTYVSRPRVVKIFPSQEEACGFFARTIALKNSGARWVTPEGLVRSRNVVGYEWLESLPVDVVEPYQFSNLLVHLERQLWGTPTYGNSVSSHLMFDKAKARVHAYLGRVGCSVTDDALLSLIAERNQDTTLTNALANSPVCPIHGDLTLDNVLPATADFVSFRLIDFRPSVNFRSVWAAEGDLYYDLAKLWVSLTIDIPKIKRGVWHEEQPLPEPLFSQENKAILELFCENRNLSFYAVERLGGLLIAAMCGVHTDTLATALYQKAIEVLGENDES